MNQTNSASRRSFFSNLTFPPSIFCNSMEGFPNSSILKRANCLNTNEIFDLAQLQCQIKEDPRLSNWEKWLKIHKQQQDQLSAKLKRPSQCMVMNSNLDNLYVNQEKRIITDASNLEYCDKYRGHPNFWKVDDSMKNDGKSVGVYQTIHQRYDRSRQSSDKCGCPLPVETEYVGVPDAILREKGLAEKSCLPTTEQKWQKSSYVLNKRECLKEKLQIIQEHLPKLSDVAIVGVGHNKTSIEPSKIIEDGSKSWTSTLVVLGSDKTSIEPSKIIEDGSKSWTSTMVELGSDKTSIEPSKIIEDGSKSWTSTLVVVDSDKTSIEPSKTTEEVGSNSISSESLLLELTSFELSQTSNRVLISVLVGDETVRGDSKLWSVCFDDCLLNERYMKSITINNLGESSLRYSWEVVMPHWVGNDLPLKHVRRRSNCFYFDKTNGAILPNHQRKLLFYFKSLVVGVFCERWKLLLSPAPDQWESVTVELQAVATEALESIENLKAIDSYIESCTRYTIASNTVRNILERSRPERPQELPYDWKFFEEQIFIHNNPDLFYNNKSVFLLKSLYEQVVGGPWDLSVQNLRTQLLRKSANEDMTSELETYASTVYQLMKPNLSTSLTNEKSKSVYELLCCFINKIESEGSNLKFVYRIPIKLKHSGEAEIDKINIKPSLISKASHASKKSLGKKTSKIKSSLGKSSIVKGSLFGSDVFSKQSLSARSDDNRFSNNDEYGTKRRKQEYLEALYVKTYDHLSHTLDHISAVIDSFEAQSKKNVLSIIKQPIPNI